MVIDLYYGLYPDFVGKRSLFAGVGNGPASYTTGGDPVTVNQSTYYIDVLFSGGLTVSGTYFVRAIPNGPGPRNTWKYKWIVVATGNEVAATTNLTGETLIAGGIGGQF